MLKNLIQKLTPNKKISRNIKKLGSIGEGHFGEIKRAKIFFRRKKSGGGIIKKNKDFIIKRFEHKEHAKESFDNWEKLKFYLIPTFKTYRLINNYEVLMTNLSDEKTFCVSINYHNLSEKNLDATYLKNNKIKEIKNFDKFLIQAIEMAKKLVENKFHFQDDVFFFTGDKSEKINLKILVGDLDMVSIYHQKLPQGFIFLQDSITTFIKLYVVEDMQDYYISELSKKMSKLVVI